MFAACAAAVVIFAGACTTPPERVVDRPGPDPDPEIDGGGDPAITCDPVVGEPDLVFERVAGGFDKPVAVVSLAGDDRLFVLEQHTGRVRIVDGGRLVVQPFVDLGGQVGHGFEQGLLSLAFHPDYAANGRFFLSYTRTDDTLAIEEWSVSADPDRARGRERVVLEIEHPTPLHNGGHIEFAPDGMLLIGAGDGGPVVDPDGDAQNRGNLLGKLLRIDVDRREGGLGYAIPDDNPLVGQPGARGEILVLGARNPWSWSIDPATAHIYLGDVGFAQWEEIDIIPSSSGGGQNLGWPIAIGDDCLEPGCDRTGLEPPVHAYRWASGVRCAVVGGRVYRGCRMPGHHGKYLFSDFCAGFVRSFVWSEQDPEVREIHDWPRLSAQVGKVSAIGVDGDGELLVVAWEAGEIHRVVPAP